MSGPSAEERKAMRKAINSARHAEPPGIMFALGPAPAERLLDALEAAERERDEARADAGRLQEALSAAGTAAWHHRIKHPPSHARLLSIEADAARLTGVVGPGHGDDPVFQKFYKDNYPDAVLEQPRG